MSSDPADNTPGTEVVEETDEMTSGLRKIADDFGVTVEQVRSCFNAEGEFSVVALFALVGEAWPPPRCVIVDRADDRVDD